MYFIVNIKEGRVLGFNLGPTKEPVIPGGSDIIWVEESYKPVEFDTKDDAWIACKIICSMSQGRVSMEDLEIRSNITPFYMIKEKHND